MVWRQVERLHGGPVSGLDLEHEFRRVAGRSDDEDMFYGLASHLTTTFSNEQRVELYRLLSRIGEHDDVKVDHYRLDHTTESPHADDVLFGGSI